MSYKLKWRNNFRYETYRPNQEQALDKISDHLDGGEKFVIGDIDTGVGKSDIAMALARSTQSAYIATSVNPLIDQYVADFGKSKDFWYIKGRRNYLCPEADDGTCLTGSEGKCALYEEKPENPKDRAKFKSRCDYKSNRNKCASKPVALTNLSFFGVGIRPGLEHSVWGKRDLAVIDEAHNLSEEVLNTVSFTISNKNLYDCGIIDDVVLRLGPNEIVEQDKFLAFLLELKGKIFLQVSKLSLNNMSEILFKDKLELMNGLLQNINWCHESIECGVEWLIELKKEKSKDRTYHKLMARPIDSGYFAQKIFFEQQASQFLLQSATIIDSKMYCSDLGIESFKYVKGNSPFDLVSKRPVFLMNSGDMSYKKASDSMPKAIKDVSNILLAYRGKRGLVHTGSYDLQRILEEKFKDNPRCIFATKDSKQQDLETFGYKKDAVLFSASMTEGFDGKDDLLRFQILMKIPYPNLSDKRIQMKSDRDSNWYIYQTKKPLIQSIGRGMRSSDDWCDYYVIDSRFEKFAEKNLPSEVTNSIYGEGNALTRMRKMYQELV